ncbi:hypothetical protein O181_098908 [Austropuccinia psidii MF-1]|uniref:Retrotransposon gag domain-containing protein n=1 Tax=Austropuccinia psidii MF-1 TaxID=1389203 RepID=A0A9Q3JA51_9BASI|nr:hypothetical protein [Austropuccinia psidii MF-1]
MPRHSTPLTEEKCSVKGSLTPFLGENIISAKDIPQLEEWPTSSGEGEYNPIEFIRTIAMFQEDFHIPDEIKVGKLDSLFSRTAMKWYYKMRQDHGKYDWSWWKSEMITKWANNSWRLSFLHPDMSDTMINMKILRKCGGELEHAIKSRCVEPRSTEEYINAMEDIITRTRTGKAWTKIAMESKMVPKASREDRKPEIPVLKCHKCEKTSNLANTCTKKTKINEFQVIEEVTEVHTHLPQYSEDHHSLININDARMCKPKPARGKGYTARASCITSVLMNDIEAKVNLDTGAFCTCVAKDYLQAILPGWKEHLLPIEDVQLSSASNNMYTLGILDTNLVSPHPAGSIRMKTEIVVMENCKSQHIILLNDYLNIYGIDINNHKDRYLTIGENKRQKFAFSNMANQI